MHLVHVLIEEHYRHCEPERPPHRYDIINN